MIRDLWIKWRLSWILGERQDLVARLKANGQRQERLLAQLEERKRRRARAEARRVINDIAARCSPEYRALEHRLRHSGDTN
jgi:flagellar biosynthesis/type III secretory pathway chaperone